MDHAILVPLDGSPLSERAIAFARYVALATRAKLVLLRVVEVHPFTDSEEIWDEIVAESDAQAYLARLVSGLTGVDPIETSIKIGYPVREILEAVTTSQVDLVVMSTHGRSGLGRLVLGSVADAVLQHSSVPMLLVSPHCIRAWSADQPRRVQVPLDGSELAERALAPAVQLAKVLDARLQLIRVVAPSDGLNRDRSTYVWTEGGAKETEDAQTYLSAIAAGLRTSDRPVATLVDRGDAAELILTNAQSEDVAAIVMATHGRVGLNRMIQGSVATRVIQEALVPVCLVAGIGVTSKTDVGSEETPLPVA